MSAPLSVPVSPEDDALDDGSLDSDNDSTGSDTGDVLSSPGSGHGGSGAGGAGGPGSDVPRRKLLKLVNWIESVIREHGGRIQGANLGSALACSNASQYRTIKVRHGGLTPLLSMFPHKFMLENDPPFNHVVVDMSAKDRAPNWTGDARKLSEDQAQEIANSVVKAAGIVLAESPGKTLKAVELANMLRNRMGKSALVTVREHRGGLLMLLEMHPDMFRVDRVPKNDSVTLIGTVELPPASAAPVLSIAMPLHAAPMGPVAAVAAAMGRPKAMSEPVVDVSSIRTTRSGPMTSPPSGIGAGSAAGAGTPGSASTPQRRTRAQSGSGSQVTPNSMSAQLSSTSTRCLHVGNVALNMTESGLRDHFSQYGRIEALKLVSRKGRRFAFVTYETLEEAEAAKAALTKHHLWRSNISFAKRETVSFPQRAPVVAAVAESPETDAKRWAGARNFAPSRHLWIGCLYNSSRRDILHAFSAYGPIENVNYLKDRHCAFVDFTRKDDCIAAFKAMQNTVLGDGVVELGFGRPWMDDSGMPTRPPPGHESDDEPQGTPGRPQFVHARAVHPQLTHPMHSEHTNFADASMFVQSPHHPRVGATPPRPPPSAVADWSYGGPSDVGGIPSFSAPTSPRASPPPPPLPQTGRTFGSPPQPETSAEQRSWSSIVKAAGGSPSRPLGMGTAASRSRIRASSEPATIGQEFPIAVGGVIAGSAIRPPLPPSMVTFDESADFSKPSIGKPAVSAPIGPATKGRQTRSISAEDTMADLGLSGTNTGFQLLGPEDLFGAERMMNGMGLTLEDELPHRDAYGRIRAHTAPVGPDDDILGAFDASAIASPSAFLGFNILTGLPSPANSPTLRGVPHPSLDVYSASLTNPDSLSSPGLDGSASGFGAVYDPAARYSGYPAPASTQP